MKKDIYIGEARIARYAAETFDDALTALVDYAAERYGHQFMDGRNMVAVRVAASDKLAVEHGYDRFDALAAAGEELVAGPTRLFIFRPAAPDHANDTVDALVQAESFVAGFEGDELQEGIADLLAGLRAAIKREQARPDITAEARRSPVAVSASERAMFDLLCENFDAWDGEEDSVKEEHADLIEKTNALIDAERPRF